VFKITIISFTIQLTVSEQLTDKLPPKLVLGMFISLWLINSKKNRLLKHVKGHSSSPCAVREEWCAAQYDTPPETNKAG
jgi:hypothetical protein